MYRALTATEAPLSPDELRLDLESIGVEVVDTNTDAGKLAQAVVKNAPDVVIAGCQSPSKLLFDAALALRTLAPCPFIIFTSDGDASKIELASECGIHAYVVEGYAKHRLLSIIQVACARFRREQALKDELSDLSQRYEERKQIDRAKGVLMRSRGVTEDEAFELLRNSAMSSRQRIGAVALGVIDMSKAGDAVNRSGQLRMLSQRIVRCYAQALAGAGAEEAMRIMADSVARADSNFAVLRKAIGSKEYGQHVNRTSSAWRDVAAICALAPDAGRLNVLDAKAEIMLKDAETLTEYLESSGLAASLHVLNVAGRQRMICQRIAKLCFLLALDPNGERLTELRQLTSSFRTAMEYLTTLPLSSGTIQDSLKAATMEWHRLSGALESLHESRVLAEIAESSEKLLHVIERLTGQYEQGMQVLQGNRIGRLR